MTPPRFVHLRLHSEYSITDGIVRIDDAVERAAADGMPALALTDLSNLFGMVKFYRAARGSGVKPILGCDVWISNESERDKPHRLLLLAQSREGYLKLSRLLSRAWLENQHRGRAELRRAWFSELEEGGGHPTQGLIALSGALGGDVGAALLQDNGAQAAKLAGAWAKLFPDRYYLELQRSGQPQAETYTQAAAMLAGKAGLPAVATHPVQFIGKDDYTAHEARVCISEGYVLSDQRRPRAFSEGSYLTTQDEMAARFADYPEALENSLEIAKRCNLVLELGKSKLPKFPTPDKSGLEDYLVAQAKLGLVRRLEALYPDAAKRAEAAPRYEERLAFESKTIIQMGFPGYFLIVADFINWARSHREPEFPNGIPVGPGRGSGAGSLVAYSLGITDLDPLAYNLLFERFLNPERVSMPDFDIDFCQEGRDRVIEYVRNKYGRESVSQIATFGTMAAKAVVRDVARVLEWPYSRADELAKLIPFQPGKLVTLRHRTDKHDTQTIYAREAEPQINQREKDDDETRQLLELAMQLEGVARNVGMHAGGVLIAPGKLTDFCPVYAAQGTENVVSQLDKDDVEAVGLVKFDFLGLTTLTILDWAVRHVRRLHDPAFSLERIPLDDGAAYKIFSSANTTAVFQFESRGMRDLLKRARPDRFEDIIALVALYRPGPMDLIPEFCDRKHGKAPDYPDPRVESILSETYGIMVYQEQVMQMAQIIGGYSLGSADLLRRAMGKKKPEEMAEHRGIFREGAAKNGIAGPKADEMFDLMEKFAGYGFNKSHAAAYALVAYHTAYMKAHFPAAFMAANMSAMMDDTDKLHQFRDDASDNGIRLLAPDINAGEYRFVPLDEKTIAYGLGGVKGTGQSAVAAATATRKEHGPFTDLFDLCRRVDKRIVNRRTIEALVRAGALDGLYRKPAQSAEAPASGSRPPATKNGAPKAVAGVKSAASPAAAGVSTGHRASLLASVGIAMEAAEQAERNANQVSLFGGADDSTAEPISLIARAPWSDNEQLLEEKAALGYYFSGHPFTAWRRELGSFLKGTLAQLTPKNEGAMLAGIVSGSRMQQTRSGRMAIIELDDGTASIEVTAFAELYDAHREQLKDDRAVVIFGKVTRDEYSGSVRVRAEKVLDMTQARSRFAREIRLSMNGTASQAGAASASRLKQLLTPHRNGPCPVAIHYRNGDATVEVRLGHDWRINLDETLIVSLREWLRPENVEILYP